nr:MAG TPA: hypothetical protein [Caudoviricetes sp.]
MSVCSCPRTRQTCTRSLTGLCACAGKGPSNPSFSTTRPTRPTS